MRDALSGHGRSIALTVLALAVFGVVGCASFGDRARPGAGEDGRSARGEPREESERSDLLAAPHVRKLSKRGWVEVEAVVLASDDESPATARRRAMDRARQAAVEFVAGVDVRSSVLTLDHETATGRSELLQALTATQSDALVIDEELVDSEVSISRGRGYRVRVVLQARVLEHARGRQAGFETEVRLNRDAYREGDAVELAVRATSDARIYVLGVSDAGTVVLLPNRQMQDTFVEADEWLRFPGERLAERGIRLQAVLPEGRVESQEALIVVALRGKRRLRNLHPASGEAFRSVESEREMTLLSDFLSPLLSIPASDWTFDQLVYRVRAN